MHFPLENIWLINVFTFQHDNDPDNTAYAVKTYNGTLSVTDWHRQSLDLSITETVWDHVDRKQKKGQPAFKEEL